MSEHDLRAAAFPRLDDAQLVALGRCPLTTLRRYPDGENSSIPGIATSRSQSSRPERLRSSTNRESRPGRSSSSVRAISRGT